MQIEFTKNTTLLGLLREMQSDAVARHLLHVVERTVLIPRAGEAHDLHMHLARRHGFVERNECSTRVSR